MTDADVAGVVGAVIVRRFVTGFLVTLALMAFAFWAAV